MSVPRRSQPADGADGSPLLVSGEQERALRGRLRGWAHGRLGLNGEDFEDMYQAGWRALLELERSGPTHSLEHALRWAIGHRWRNELRRRARRPTVYLDTSDHPSLVAPDETPERVVHLEEARYLLEAANGLSERHWQVLLLADVCELAPAEVSAILNISLRTYRREHACALSAITARLEEISGGGWCADHRELLATHEGGRTAPRQAQIVRWHLSNCLTCRRALSARPLTRAGECSRTPAGVAA